MLGIGVGRHSCIQLSYYCEIMQFSRPAITGEVAAPPSCVPTYRWGTLGMRCGKAVI